MHRLLSLLLLTTTCCGNSACSGGLTIGPTIEREFVIVYPGQPIRVLSNIKVRGQRLGDSSLVESQSIGGWVAMPIEHWQAVQRRLEATP